MRRNDRSARAARPAAKSGPNYQGEHIPAITAGLYKAFLGRGRVGRDALAVYQHLLYTSVWQHTNCVWATNSYIQKGIRMGERRVNVAKSELSKMDLIRAVQLRDKKGRVKKTFTLLKLVPNPGPRPTRAKSARVESKKSDPTHAEDAYVEKVKDSTTPASTARVADRICGPGPQMLKEEIKCFGKKGNEEVGVDEPSSSVTGHAEEDSHAD